MIGVGMIERYVLRKTLGGLAAPWRSSACWSC
jgi:hypothetical protein